MRNKPLEEYSNRELRELLEKVISEMNRRDLLEFMEYQMHDFEE